MFDRNKERARKISRIAIGFCLVVFFTWILAGQFTEVAKAGREASKKLELKQLERALSLSELTYGEYPENRNKPDWCVVGERYGDRTCLYELTRDGFMSVLPVSPDDHPYLYIQENRNAFVAVGFNNPEEIPDDQSCVVNDETLWCVRVTKL